MFLERSRAGSIAGKLLINLVVIAYINKYGIFLIRKIKNDPQIILNTKAE